MQRIAWLLLAALHLLPALALFRPALLTRLYGATDASVTLLLQHRAGLFLAVLAACLLAMFDGDSRRAAGVVTAISMISFLLLYVLGGAPASLRMIAYADFVGLPALAYVLWTAFAPSR